MNPYLEKARRGAALLDDKNPDWWNKIDIMDLDMYSIHYCVLFQLYSNYCQGLLELTDIPDASVTMLSEMNFDSENGFDLSLEEYDANDVRSTIFVLLTAAWKQVIEERHNSEESAQLEDAELVC